MELNVEKKPTPITTTKIKNKLMNAFIVSALDVS